MASSERFIDNILILIVVISIIMAIVGGSMHSSKIIWISFGSIALAITVIMSRMQSDNSKVL